MIATLPSIEVTDFGLPLGYLLRSATLDDAPATVAMINAHSQHLIGADEITTQSLQVEWSAPQVGLPDDVRVILTPDGQLVACAGVWGLFEPYARINVWLRVHPAHQQRGLEAALLRWAEEHVRQAALPRASTGTRICLTSYRSSIDAVGKAAYEQAGFTTVRYMHRMRIDLGKAPLPVVWPAGVTVRSFVPGQDEAAALQVVRESFRDHWGYVAPPFEEDLKLLRHWMTDPIFDPALWLLVLVGERLVAISLNTSHLDEDPEMGWVSALGVLREYRHRGIARALLLHAFGQFYQRGRNRVGLGVDTQNLTGALRLYESVGMRAYRTTHFLEKELRPGVELSTRALAA